jgi:hypothetical protein
VGSGEGSRATGVLHFVIGWIIQGGGSLPSVKFTLPCHPVDVTIYVSAKDKSGYYKCPKCSIEYSWRLVNGKIVLVPAATGGLDAWLK